MTATGTPDKDVLVPPYDYLSEGVDPKKCEALNANSKAEYEAEKERRLNRINE